MQKSDQDPMRERMLNAIREDYERIPYQSFPYPKSSPAHLRTIGKLFGMDPPALDTARILELGCAAGGNIIPLAVQYPKAQFVGVDLSGLQISAGREFIGQLGLTNIELRSCSITDIGKSDGSFDYIIAHGVFSWVPDFVREHMMRICQELLRPSGIAYISYNALPGWNSRRIIRDMALYHGRNISEPADRIRETKELLEFIGDALGGSDDSYARLIRESIELLKDKQDHFIAHDLLERENKAFYFSEFIEMAGRYGLKFLAEASIPSMYLGNYSDAINESLSQIHDIIKTEQYLDFITNRHFRATLLCGQNQDAVVERTLRKESLRGCFMRMRLVPGRRLDQVDIADETEDLQFDIGPGASYTLTTRSPVLKAVLYVFADFYNAFLDFDELITRASAKLSHVSRQMILDETDGSLLSLFLAGRLDIRMDPVAVNHRIPDRPQAWSYAAAQCRYLPVSYVTNPYHESVEVSVFEKAMLPLLDGTRTSTEVLEAMMEQAGTGLVEWSPKVEQSHFGEQRMREIIGLSCMESLEKFARSGLLA